MIKSALLASVLCLAFVVPASAQQTAKCDDAWFTSSRAKIDAMTDKKKQAAAMESWEAANNAFKANNMQDCNDRIGDTGKSMDGGGDNQGGDQTQSN